MASIFITALRAAGMLFKGSRKKKGSKKKKGSRKLKKSTGIHPAMIQIKLREMLFDDAELLQFSEEKEGNNIGMWKFIWNSKN